MSANTLLTIGQITRDAAMVLGNTLDLVKRVNRAYDSDFGIKSALVGKTINLRRPIKPLVRTGEVVDIQPILETYSPLTFSPPIGCDYALTTTELTFSIEDYLKTVTEPSMQVIASEIERQGIVAAMANFSNSVGTPGTALTGGPTGTARAAIGQALALLNANLAPPGPERKTLLIDPYFSSLLVDTNASLFNPSAAISAQYTSGMFQGAALGFGAIFMNQLTPRTTAPVFGGTPLTNYGTPFAAVDTWAQTATLVTDGWTATTTVLPAGTIFTIANVNSVNPTTKVSTGVAKQFTVTANTVTDGSGNSTITYSPAIVTTGPYQNVSAAPANNAAISIVGATTVASQVALAFDRDALVLANKDLVPFSSGMSKVITDDQTGIGVRVSQLPDIKTNQEILRFDVNVAWAVLYPELGVKIFTS
jgi:hypothetical protein